MRSLLTTEKEVEKILEEVPITRTSDNLLYAEYWRRKAPHISFYEFWLNFKKYDASPYKSVERARRTIQSRRPDLEEKTVKEARTELEMEYYNYAKKGR